jgi:hypothetical protein
MYRILTVYREKEAQIELLTLTSLIVELGKVQPNGLNCQNGKVDVKKHNSQAK